MPSLQETLLVVASLAVAFVSSSVGFLGTFMIIEKKVQQYFRAAMFTTFTIIALRLLGVYFHLPVSYFMMVLIGETLVLVLYLRIFGFIHLGYLNVLTKNILHTAGKELFSAHIILGLCLHHSFLHELTNCSLKNFLPLLILVCIQPQFVLQSFLWFSLVFLRVFIMPRITIANGEKNRSRIALISAFIFAGSGIALMFLFIFLEELSSISSTGVSSFQQPLFLLFTRLAFLGSG